MIPTLSKQARLAFFLLVSIAQATDLKNLSDNHRWNEFHLAQPSSALDQAVDAAVFNDLPRAELLLKSVLKTNPQAYDWLARIYFRTGRYHSLIQLMKRRGRLSKGLKAFRGLPDQVTGEAKPGQLPHEPGDIFIPLTINNKPATYFFDTGGWLNSMSESEAKRLGLAIHESGGKLGTGTGVGVGFRTAVAPEVIIGEIHYRNVTFAVFRDDQEPWSLLAEGRRGLVGFPLIQGFKAFRWVRDGGLEIGLPTAPFDATRANLYLDDNNMTMAAEFNGERIVATVDTGANTSDLYEAFAGQFPKFLDENGTKDKTEIRGVGHAETFESVTLPDLTFALGGSKAVFRSAHVVRKQIGNKHAVGNFGMDLFKQGTAFKIDLGAMRLDLEP